MGIIDVPIFYGEGDDLMEWVCWINDFCYDQGFSDCETQRFAYGFIEGEALGWYHEESSRSVFKSWANLKLRLLMRFSKCETQPVTTSRKDLLNQLSRLLDQWDEEDEAKKQVKEEAMAAGDSNHILSSVQGFVKSFESAPPETVSEEKGDLILYSNQLIPQVKNDMLILDYPVLVQEKDDPETETLVFEEDNSSETEMDDCACRVFDQMPKQRKTVTKKKKRWKKLFPDIEDQLVEILSHEESENSSMLGIQMENTTKRQRKLWLEWGKGSCHWVHARQKVDRKWLLMFKTKKRNRKIKTEKNCGSYERSKRCKEAEVAMLRHMIRCWYHHEMKDTSRTWNKNLSVEIRIHNDQVLGRGMLLHVTKLEKNKSKCVKHGDCIIDLWKTKMTVVRKVVKHGLVFSKLLRRPKATFKKLAKWHKHKFKEKHMKQGEKIKLDGLMMLLAGEIRKRAKSRFTCVDDEKLSSFVTMGWMKFLLEWKKRKKKEPIYQRTCFTNLLLWEQKIFVLEWGGLRQRCKRLLKTFEKWKKHKVKQKQKINDACLGSQVVLHGNLKSKIKGWGYKVSEVNSDTFQSMVERIAKWKKWRLKHKFKDKKIREWFPSNQVTCLWSPKLQLIPVRRTKFFLEEREQHMTSRRGAENQRKYREGKVKLCMVRKEKHADIIHLVLVGVLMSRHKTICRTLGKRQKHKFKEKSNTRGEKNKLNALVRRRITCELKGGTDEESLRGPLRDHGVKRKMNGKHFKNRRWKYKPLEGKHLKFQPRRRSGFKNQSMEMKQWKRVYGCCKVLDEFLKWEILIKEKKKSARLENGAGFQMCDDMIPSRVEGTGLIVSRNDEGNGMWGYRVLLRLELRSSHVVYGKLRHGIVRRKVMGRNGQVMIEFKVAASQFFRGKTHSTHDETTQEAMIKRVVQLKNVSEQAEQYDEKKQLNERSAKLSGRVVVIQVGAHAERRCREKKRLHTCKDAGRAAMEIESEVLSLTEGSYDLEDKVSFNGTGIDTKAYTSEEQMGQ